MPKVLVTDCWTRKGLSVVRSLGSENIEVFAVTHKIISPAIYSKYTKKIFIFSSPEKNKKEFQEKILALISKEKFDCLMPLEDESTLALLEIREEIEKHTVLPVGTMESYKIASNKWKTLQIAEKSGVPIPQSFYPSTDKEISEALETLRFPVVIKPISSGGSRGLKKAYNKNEFEKYYPEIRKKYGIPLIQECLRQDGQGIGVGILAEHGRVLVSFSYKRLREYPVNGGPSTLRESTDNKLIKDYSEKLIKEIGWHGVAMVEFKTDMNDNLPKLMEINPRFWGSLELASVSGINFPHLLFLLSQKKEIPLVKYNAGIRCRWLLPGDIAHFISNPERFKIKPSFFNFFEKNTFYDEFRKGDFRGNIASVLCAFLSFFDFETWKKGIFRI